MISYIPFLTFVFFVGFCFLLTFGAVCMSGRFHDHNNERTETVQETPANPWATFSAMLFILILGWSFLFLVGKLVLYIKTKL